MLNYFKLFVLVWERGFLHGGRVRFDFGIHNQASIKADLLLKWASLVRYCPKMKKFVLCEDIFSAK